MRLINQARNSALWLEKQLRLLVRLGRIPFQNKSYCGCSFRQGEEVKTVGRNSGRHWAAGGILL
jgi:hypothetical protein